MSLTRTHAVHVLAALTAVTTLTTGCGGDEETSAPPASAASLDDQLEIVAVDYAFQGLAQPVNAGTRLSLRNGSASEVHELVAVRLPDQERRPADVLLQLDPAELGSLLNGPPDLVLVAPPDEEGFVVLGDGTLSQPGRYLVFCAIPTGADPEDFLSQVQQSQDGPPQVEGGPPHFTQGMHGELTVE